jgi:hypothetical protein
VADGRRRHDPVPCPDPLHAGSKVKSVGTRRAASGLRRDYLCRPTVGKRHSRQPRPTGPPTPAGTQRTGRSSVTPALHAGAVVTDLCSAPANYRLGKAASSCSHASAAPAMA